MAATIYDIPSGPKNLESIFPDIDFNNVKEYFLEVIDDSAQVIATTPLMRAGCCCGSEDMRLFFLNYLGKFDGMSFSKPEILHESTSGLYKKSLNYPLVKTDTGTERFDVSANDSFIASTKCYRESDMLWAQELIDSPKAFMQWTGIQGQEDSYIPIVIKSTKFDKQKNKDEWFYEIVIEFELSNEFIVIRN